MQSDFHRFFRGIATLCFLSISMISVAQRPPENILIYKGAEDKYQPCEPSIAVSPKSTEVMVAGSILDNVHLSTDGGYTWKTDQLNSKFGVFGDPCIVGSPKGDFYYLHLSNPDGQAWSSEALLDRIVIQRSRRKGKRWNAGAGVGLNGAKDQDKEWSAVSTDGSTLLMCWTQFDLYGSPLASDESQILCSTSNHRAKKWSDPVRINEIRWRLRGR
jgi:hypothetical protein